MPAIYNGIQPCALINIVSRCPGGRVKGGVYGYNVEYMRLTESGSVLGKQSGSGRYIQLEREKDDVRSRVHALGKAST